MCFHFAMGTTPEVLYAIGIWGVCSSLLCGVLSMSDACEFEVFSEGGNGEIFFQSMIGIDGARSGAWTL